MKARSFIQHQIYAGCLILLVALFTQCCKGNNNEDPIPDPSFVNINYLLKSENGIYHLPEPVSIDVNFKNPSNYAYDASLICKIKSDDHKEIDLLTYKIKVNSNEEKIQNISFFPPSPGIYQCAIYILGDYLNSDTLQFNIGYDPEKIACAADSKPDFDSFWEQTRTELNEILPAYELTLLEEYSTGPKNVYKVKMKSYENVDIAGYYAAPKTGGPFPVIIQYLGYGGDSEIPNPEWYQDKCIFRLSVRGQGILKPENNYGDWMLYGLESRDSYYYRGAYMDVIRAIDFVSSRPEVDHSRIIAEGGSQGATFAIVASALDNRIRVCNIAFPFFSDIKDNFNIVTGWPKDVFDSYLENHPDQNRVNLYDILSYYDVKNFAPKIKCPVFISISLQDEICPPHIQFSVLNLIKTEKEHYVCVSCGHFMDGKAGSFADEFIGRHLK